MAERFAPHLERLLAVAASADWIAYGGRRDAASVTTSTVHALAGPKVEPRWSAPVDNPVYALAFLAQQHLAAGGEGGEVVVWALPQVDPVVRRVLHTKAVRALAADPKGETLVSVGDDGQLRVSQRQGDTLVDVASHALTPQPLRAVAFDGQRAVAVGDEGVLAIVEGLAGDEGKGRVVPLGVGPLSSVALTDDGRAVVGGRDGGLRLVFLDGEPDLEDRSGERGHQGPVVALVPVPGGLDAKGQPLPRRVFSLGADGDLKLWPLDQRRAPRTLGVGSDASAMAWRPLPPGRRSARREGDAPEATAALVVVTRRRRLWWQPLDAGAGAVGDPQVVESRLAQLDRDLRGARPSPQLVDVLGEIPEDEARLGLSHLLGRDRRPPVRGDAAAQLGRRGDPRAKEVLGRALDDQHPKVRQQAWTALLALAATTPLAPYEAALKSRHQDLRLAALQALGEGRVDSPLVPGLIAAALKDSVEGVRRQALESLIALDPEALTPLVTAFDQGSSDVRIQVLQRVGARGLVLSSGARLVQRALADAEAAVRHTAFWLGVAARPPLAHRLKALSPTYAKPLAALDEVGAGDVGHGSELAEAHLAPLFTAMASRQLDVAALGLACLASLGDARAAGAILQLTRETAVDARRQGARLLAVAAAARPDPRATQRLHWLLNDEDPNVRGEAFGAYETVLEPEGDKGQLALAQMGLATPHPDIRARALALLVPLGPKAAAPVAAEVDKLLGDALDDEASDVRGEAFQVLWSWYSKRPQAVLTRAAHAAHADIRRRAVAEAARQRKGWAKTLLLEGIGDPVAEVGAAAYQALLDREAEGDRDAPKPPPSVEYLLAALAAPPLATRALGAREAQRLKAQASHPAGLRTQLLRALGVEEPDLFIPAIEALDHLYSEDAQAFAQAFDSPFYALRVRAGELCGRRRDKRATGPMVGLLTIPRHREDRPDPSLRRRAAAALADVGDTAAIAAYRQLLDDDDPRVREEGARGLAAACDADHIQPLVEALAHPDLPVRSWVAEGLAKLGDERALPVLAGTQRHAHPPLRRGALLGFVALGPAGVAGLLQGLEDPDENLQELMLAVILARDIALARSGEPPDLLLTALAAARPEVRLAAARALEARLHREDLAPQTVELVGPRRPERAVAMADWPEEGRRPRLLNAVIDAVASETPQRRYAGAYALSLRGKPPAFWRQAEALVADPSTPASSTGIAPGVPEGGRGWLRRLFAPTASPGLGLHRVLTVVRYAGGRRAVPAAGDAAADRTALVQLLFGTYSGLIRQAPTDGDEGQRVRRDAVEGVRRLAADPAVGQAAAAAVLHQALDDPHHRVRRAALGALRALEGGKGHNALAMALDRAPDLGKAAFDELLAAALAGDEGAAAKAVGAVNAATAEVRRHAVPQLPRLYPAASLEPWLLALESDYVDTRLAVVERLADADDPRVGAALQRALESDDPRLRQRAATALARRGDGRCLDVLLNLLDGDEGSARRGLSLLVELVHARTNPPLTAAVAGALTQRLDDALDALDSGGGEALGPLLDSLKRVAHPPVAVALAAHAARPDLPDALVTKLLDTAEALLVDPAPDHKTRRSGETQTPRRHYRADLAAEALSPLLDHEAEALRRRALAVVADLDTPWAEERLLGALADRSGELRALAVAGLARRMAEETASPAVAKALSQVVGAGERALLLPAAEALARQRRPEAFQPLLLLFKAGEGDERSRGLLALGTLGDARALEVLEPLVDLKTPVDPADEPLRPVAIEALGALLPQLGPERQPRCFDQLTRLTFDPPNPLRLAALAAWRRVGGQRGREQLQAIALDELETSAVRLQAVAELGRLGDAAAQQTLEPLLSHGSRPLRQGAHRALEQLFADDPSAVALVALSSSDPAISGPAATQLARRGDLAPLLRRLPAIGDGQVRQRLRRGLVRRRPLPGEALQDLLAGPDPVARAEGAWLLGAASDPAAAQAQAPALLAAAAASAEAWATHPHDAEVRAQHAEAWWACLWAARQLGIDARAQARQALDDPAHPSNLLAEAARLLATRVTAEDTPRLGNLLERGEGVGEAAAAAAALAQLEGATGGAVLAASLRRRPTTPVDLAAPDQRRAALPIYLGENHPEALLGAVNAATAPVRLAALAALGRWGDPAAVEALEAFHRDRERPDAERAAAFRALKRAQRGAKRRSNPPASSAGP